MIVLRLIAVFIVTVLLTGCTIKDLKADIKDLKADVKAAKADVKTLKAYLTAFPPPNACKPPGTPQAMICPYKLEIKRDKQLGLFTGHVAKSVVDNGKNACEEIRGAIKKENPEVQECLDPKDYAYIEYALKITDTPSDLNGIAPPGMKDGTYEFVNIPYSEHLLKLKEEFKLEIVER